MDNLIEKIRIRISARFLCASETVTSLPQLKQILAHCGVAFVVLPPLAKINVQSLSFYDRKTLILVIALIETDTNQFWIQLLQELGHIIYEEDAFQALLATDYLLSIPIQKDRLRAASLTKNERHARFKQKHHYTPFSAPIHSVMKWFHEWCFYIYWMIYTLMTHLLSQNQINFCSCTNHSSSRQQMDEGRHCFYWPNILAMASIQRAVSNKS